MRCSDVDVVACREVIAGRYTDAEVAGSRADARGGAPCSAVVRRLAVIYMEDARVRVLTIIVPDRMEDTLLVSLHPGLDLVGVRHARRGQYRCGTPGRAIIGAPAKVRYSRIVGRSAVRPHDYHVAVVKVHRVGRDWVHTPDAAA